MRLDTHVIILAAGLGRRLQPYTADTPKCLLDLGGKTLLQRQLDAYALNGLQTIHLVRGYKKDRLNYPGIT